MEERKSYLDRVYDFIRKHFKFVSPEVAEWIACLSGLESAFGTSYIAEVCNNFIGMKFPKVRISTALSERLEHAYYSSFESCICDFFFWCQFVGMRPSDFKTLDAFIRKFRATKYNLNPEYINCISNLKEHYYGKNQ